MKAASTYFFPPGMKAAYEVAVLRNHLSASFGSGAFSFNVWVIFASCFLVAAAESTTVLAPE